MRGKTTKEKIKKFFERLGQLTKLPTQVYLTGGASAVLNPWRDSTLDIDLKIIPDSSDMLKHIPSLKEELNINVELASPTDFIPELPGWKERLLYHFPSIDPLSFRKSVDSFVAGL